MYMYKYINIYIKYIYIYVSIIYMYIYIYVYIYIYIICLKKATQKQENIKTEVGRQFQLKRKKETRDEETENAESVTE